MSGRIFIHATNVHQGGGRVLLECLLSALDRKTDYVLCLDTRMSIPLESFANVHIRTVAPSIFQRWIAEKWLSREVTSDDVILCFGNLPPLFKLRGRVLVFLQNRYLIDAVTLDQFPLKVRLRLFIERLWLSAYAANVNEFIVQTPTMKRLLEDSIPGLTKIRVLPFVANPAGFTRSLKPVVEKSSIKGFSFFYVASGEPHKNHTMLLNAWCHLAEQGIFPKLFLTLDQSRFSGLCQEIEALRQLYGLQISNLDNLSHRDVLCFYRKVDALIYPSTFESFGLPLIEARQAGLPVLAPELDYVRDLIDPEQAFDPKSATSIARAVKQFMGVKQESLPLMDARAFMATVLAWAE